MSLLIIREFITYGLIGILNTLIHFICFLLLLEIIKYQTIANFFGFMAGLIFSFFMNAKFTFKQDVSLIKFVKMTLVSGGISIFFGFIGDYLSLSPYLTFSVYVLVNPIIGFLLTRFYVFNKKR